MKKSSHEQIFQEKSSKNVYNNVAIMSKPIKERLKEMMDKRGVKIPAVAGFTGIPKDRIYAWYRDDTEPKAEDRDRLLKWMGEENSNSEISLPDKATAYDALFSVLIADYAAWKAQQTGENPEVITRKIYKAAEDVQRMG